MSDGSPRWPIIDMRALSWINAEGRACWVLQIRREGATEFESVPGYVVSPDGKSWIPENPATLRPPL